MKWPWRSDPVTPRSSGEEAEQFANRYLRSQGMKILATNYRCRGGELDIVGQERETLVVVEVRLRNNRRFVSAADSVDTRKQQRIILAAENYLLHHYGDHPPPCRFDVIALSPGLDPVTHYHVEWIRDAFRPGF